jgi:hypothetical protein
MKIFSVAAILMSLVVWAYGKQQPEFQTGKLIDVTSDERLFEGTTVRHAVYQVQVGDMLYFGRGEHLNHRSGDPGHGLIIGDPVQVSIEGEHLILQRPDGKEIKTKIIERRRAP